MEEEDDETGGETFTKVLAGVGLAAALVVLGLQFKIAGTWINAVDQEETRKGDWSLLLE